MPRVSEQASCAQPKVSVSMITYNHEKFIAQAIESVLMQETEFPVELVIGEDCSPDGTRKVVQEYAARNPQVIRALLPASNLGMMRNAVQTARACRGKYLAALEGDDYWTDSRKLQRQVDFLESNPDYVGCFHNVRVVHEDGSQPDRIHMPADAADSYTIEDVIGESFVPTCSVVQRNHVPPDLPKWFLEVASGDIASLILLLEHGKLKYLNEVMATRRLHSGGIHMAHYGSQRFNKRMFLIKSVDRHLGHRFPGPIRNWKAHEYAALYDYLMLQTDPAVRLRLRRFFCLHAARWHRRPKGLTQVVPYLLRWYTPVLLKGLVKKAATGQA